MRIGIIGAGRVGVTMGKYLGDAGVEVSGFYSKTTQSAVQAAEFTDTTVITCRYCRSERHPDDHDAGWRDQ